MLKDLIIDRGAFDRIMQAGGFISMNTGGTPDANCFPVSKERAELSMDAAACIGCGACVASCKNASAMLFVSAKVAQFAYLPQGQLRGRGRWVRASGRTPCPRRGIPDQDHQGTQGDRIVRCLRLAPCFAE